MRQPEIEAMDRGELELLQLERLQSTLTRAYRQVKFYRRRFDQMGLNLDDIRSLNDLARLPCTTRGDLSENYPYGLFAVPLRDIVRILSSPGTTEKPLVVGYAAPDLKLWLELLARLYVAAGVTREDILQIILPPGLANWRRDLQAGAENLGASVIPPATLNFAKELMVMRDYKTSVLVTTPPLARHLLTVMARMNLSPAELSRCLRRCAGRSRRGSKLDAPQPMASPRSWVRVWPSAAAPTGGSIFRKTISIRRSSTLKPGTRRLPAPPGSW
jgi:phenylacetate-CoA ligase